ncbi:MAG TPA: hypothetical protein VJA22_01855, partial [Patescibacteria group bacterium]|nr:hypothetical protein [Patescibacteria group bacterium]
ALVVAGDPAGLQDLKGANAGSSDLSVGYNLLSDPAGVSRYIISVGLLMAGLKVAAEVGGAGGGLASKLSGKIGAFAVGAYVGAKMVGKKSVKAVGYGVAGRAMGQGFFRSAFTDVGRKNVQGMAKGAGLSAIGQRGAFASSQETAARNLMRAKQETGQYSTSAKREAEYQKALKTKGGRGKIAAMAAMYAKAESGDATVNASSMDSFNAKFGSTDLETGQGQATAAFNEQIEAMAVKSGGKSFKGKVSRYEFDSDAEVYRTITNEKMQENAELAVAGANRSDLATIITGFNSKRNLDGSAQDKTTVAQMLAMSGKTDMIGSLDNQVKMKALKEMDTEMSRLDPAGDEFKKLNDVRKYFAADYDTRNKKYSFEAGYGYGDTGVRAGYTIDKTEADASNGTIKFAGASKTAAVDARDSATFGNKVDHTVLEANDRRLVEMSTADLKKQNEVRATYARNDRLPETDADKEENERLSDKYKKMGSTDRQDYQATVNELSSTKSTITQLGQNAAELNNEGKVTDTLNTLGTSITNFTTKAGTATENSVLHQALKDVETLKKNALKQNTIAHGTGTDAEKTQAQKELKKIMQAIADTMTVAQVQAERPVLTDTIRGMNAPFLQRVTRLVRNQDTRGGSTNLTRRTRSSHASGIYNESTRLNAENLSNSATTRKSQIGAAMNRVSGRLNNLRQSEQNDPGLLSAITAIDAKIIALQSAPNPKEADIKALQKQMEQLARDYLA